MMNHNAAIRQAIRTVAFDEALAAFLGLNPTDLRCLELVIEDPGMTPSRLAELAGITTGAVTGVVDRLERAGYVTRQPDPADRRSVTIAPVPARETRIVEAVAPLGEAIDSLLAACTPDQRDAIGRFLAAATHRGGRRDGAPARGDPRGVRRDAASARRSAP